MTSGELAGSDGSCFACILAAVARVSYLFHFYWMDSGFFIPSGSRGHAHSLVLVRFLCWQNEHVRTLTAAEMTYGPLLTLTGVHLKTHTCWKHTYTICHRPSGHLTDRRGRWEGAALRYSIAAGNSLDHSIAATSQIPGQSPPGPTQSPWCNCPPFTRISHANSFRTSIFMLGVWETQKLFPGDFFSVLHLEWCLHGKTRQWYAQESVVYRPAIDLHLVKLQ